MSNRFYPTGTEIDLRQEMFNTLDGAFPEVTKKMPVVLRKMRIQNGALIACPCVDPITHEPDRDNYCPICMGEGYLWDESFIDTYKVLIKSDVGNAQKESLFGPGIVNMPIVVFYVKYNISVTENDKIVELVLDTEGIPTKPYQRKDIYRITSAIDLRLDHGKIQYLKLACFSEKRKYLNGNGG